MHHGRSRKQVVHVVHTKYEVNPSIIRDCRPIQLKNRVFEPLTVVSVFLPRIRRVHAIWGSPSGWSTVSDVLKNLENPAIGKCGFVCFFVKF